MRRVADCLMRGASDRPDGGRLRDVQRDRERPGSSCRKRKPRGRLVGAVRIHAADAYLGQAVFQAEKGIPKQADVFTKQSAELFRQGAGDSPREVRK